MEEIATATAPQMIFCSGNDSVAKSKAQFDIKSSDRVCKVGLDGAASGCTLIQHNRCLASLISSFEEALFIFSSTDWTSLN